MRKQNIFQHSTGATETVKQGWSWPAFIFTFIWAFVKRLWWIGLSTWVLMVALNLIIKKLTVLVGISSTLKELIHFGLTLPVYIVFGLYGNMWREKNLLARGYSLHHKESVEEYYQCPECGQTDLSEVPFNDQVLEAWCQNCQKYVRKTVSAVAEVLD